MLPKGPPALVYKFHSLTYMYAHHSTSNFFLPQRTCQGNVSVAFEACLGRQNSHGMENCILTPDSGQALCHQYLVIFTKCLTCSIICFFTCLPILSFNCFYLPNVLFVVLSSFSDVFFVAPEKRVWSTTITVRVELRGTAAVIRHHRRSEGTLSSFT